MDACQDGDPGPVDLDGDMERAIEELLDQRRPNRPSEAARAVNPAGWRALMPAARVAAGAWRGRDGRGHAAWRYPRGGSPSGRHLAGDQLPGEDGVGNVEVFDRRQRHADAEGVTRSPRRDQVRQEQCDHRAAHARTVYLGASPTRLPDVKESESCQDKSRFRIVRRP
jgi:Protein of unknown function (DUF3253)